MDQLVIVILILGLIFLGEKTGNPLYNLISAVFSFYLAFTVGIHVLMIGLIFLGVFQLVYLYKKFKN